MATTNEATVGQTKAWDDMTSEERALVVARAKRRGVRASSHPAWAGMVAIVRETGWPRAFEADFWIHDVNSLRTRDPKEAFAWALGETGTFLARGRTGMGYSSRRNRTLADAILEERPRAYIYDGVSLRAVDRDTFDAFLSGRVADEGTES